MHKKIGSQSFHVMKKTCMMLAIFLTLSPSLVQAANQFLVIAPGQSYAGNGTAPNLATPDTLVAGEQYDIDIFCYDNASPYYPQDSNFNTVTLTTPGLTSTISPSGSAQLGQNYGTSPAPDTPRARYDNPGVLQATITINATSNTNAAINVTSGGGGIQSSVNVIPVQVISSFVFTTLPSPYTAGISGAVIVEARDAGNNLCSTFDGSATIEALDAGVNGATVTLTNLDFENGIATPAAYTFYHATDYARFRVQRGSVTSYQSFIINSPGFTDVLIVGPGQSLRQGESGGNGRTSGSLSTSAQTAGAPFAITVFAVDAFWNTVNAGTQTVNLTATDPAYGGQSGNFASNSRVWFTWGVNNPVEFHTVTSLGVTLTATQSAMTSTDTIPLNSTTLNHFAINTIADTTANAAITLTVRGYDAYGNTVTSVPGTTAIVLQDTQGTGYVLSPTYLGYTLSPAMGSSEFSGDGTYTGTLRIRRAAADYRVRITNTTISPTESNDFDIDPGTAARYIVVMPGQTYMPGEQFGGIWGRNGNASNVVAGIATPVSIVATDGYGNRVSVTENLTWSPTSHLTVPDAGASVDPNPIQIVNGEDYPEFTFSLATIDQDLTVPYVSLIPQSSGDFDVIHATLNHFQVSVSTGQTAGNNYATTIRAQDEFDNTVSSFNSNVYISCPQLDYLGPTESVLRITGGGGTPNYSTYSANANWSLNGASFASGVLSVTTTIYRATTGSAQARLFVSTNPDDTLASINGNTGLSSAITVAPANYSWMFCIVPGLTHRPGGIDASGVGAFTGNGYQGTPLSQQVNTAFSITVYATDAYWNLITTANDQFTTTTSPDTCNIHNQTTTLIGGARRLSVIFTAQNTYSILITNPSTGVADYSTQLNGGYSIIAFTLDHFTMVGAPTWAIAGVPFYVTFTAYRTASQVADTFDGTADLKSNTDHNDTLRCIRPTQITFEDGVWEGEVTRFRSDRYDGDANDFYVQFGTVKSSTSGMHVVQNDPKKLLIIAPGMTAYPGLNPDVWPDYPGAEGQPAVQTAGSAITNIAFYLCDYYWNPVTSVAEAYEDVQVYCSDPYPAEILGEGDIVGGLPISLSRGARECINTFILYTVNGTSGQSVRVEKAGHTSFELGVNRNRVPVRHALASYDTGSAHTRFRFYINFAAIASNTPTAGVAFPITVTAIDAYGNTLDSINGATAFPTYGSVDLAANTDSGGNKSVWPTKLGTLEATRWQSGISYPWVYLFKKVTGSGQFLTATYDFGAGNRSGKSDDFNVLANIYKRLVAIMTGMTATPDNPGNGGTYSDPLGVIYPTSPPPATATVFNNFGTPSAVDAGDHINLQAYVCDAYGNVTVCAGGADLVRMTNSDVFAPNSPDLDISEGNGYTYANFGQWVGNTYNAFYFHTEGIRTITVADASRTTITAGTTPNITVEPGDFYGLQVIIPGLIAVEGSGNSNIATLSGTEYIPVPDSGWYSGVTPTRPWDYTLEENVYRGQPQLAGAEFGVSVQAVDMFGNFCGSEAPGHNIRLISDDYNINAHPTASAPMYDDLDNGVAFFYPCNLRTTGGGRQLKPRDEDDYGPGGIIGADDSLAITEVVEGTQTRYEVAINGVTLQDNTPVVVDAYPSTFNVFVRIAYIGTNETVNVSLPFRMEPFLTNSANPTPVASGHELGKEDGMTVQGQSTITDQTYTHAEDIYIRVRNASGSNTPSAAYSPRIIVSASQPNSIELLSDAQLIGAGGDNPYYQIEANNTTRIRAVVRDINNNVVSGQVVNFQITSPAETTSVLTTPQSLTTSSSNGEAYITFSAGADNLEHIIRGSVQGMASIYDDLTMRVTVTRDGGVYPNPFNPLRGENAHIDYRLDRDSKVTVELFTLLGDLVCTKQFASGSEGGHTGVNSILWNGKNDNGITIANGGYICVVKADDQEVKRFKIGVFKEK